VLTGNQAPCEKVVIFASITISKHPSALQCFCSSLLLPVILLSRTPILSAIHICTPVPLAADYTIAQMLPVSILSLELTMNRGARSISAVQHLSAILQSAHNFIYDLSTATNLMRKPFKKRSIYAFPKPLGSNCSSAPNSRSYTPTIQDSSLSSASFDSSTCTYYARHLGLSIMIHPHHRSSTCTGPTIFDFESDTHDSKRNAALCDCQTLAKVAAESLTPTNGVPNFVQC
jgi:hypothetical protein